VSFYPLKPSLHNHIALSDKEELPYQNLYDILRYLEQKEYIIEKALLRK